MLSFASHAIAGNFGSRNNLLKPSQVIPDCSDDEGSPCAGREEGLECPICCESFNIVENVPYVLWCGHTICKNCILRIQWAVLKFPALPVQLPLFISCPWCNCLSLRLVYRGQLKFPRKNFFLLWLVESMSSSNHSKWHSAFLLDGSACNPNNSQTTGSNDDVRQESIQRITQGAHSDNPHSNSNQGTPVVNFSTAGGIKAFLWRSLVSLVHLTSRFPLVVVSLFILLYVIPASAVVLALYILVTFVFALPSLLILYFAYPSLDWLVREITS